MTGKNANPSQNPADLDTLAGTLRIAFQKLMQATDGMLPATVVAVDSKRNFATVKPLISVLDTNNQLTQRAQIAKVPIFTAGAGGFVLSFPIKPGDLGWIFASDRDISLFTQTLKQSGPNTRRLHSFQDGMFIPDAMRQWTLAGEDANNAVWQSTDGTTKITIGTGKIRIVHPTKVEIVTPLVTMSNDLTVAGTITGTTDVKAGAISGKHHTHPGVTTGSGSTGQPA